MDTITIAITFPQGGFPFRELVDAVKAERDRMARCGDMAAYQTLHTLATLAERGMLAFETDIKPSFIPNRVVAEEPRDD